MTDSPADSNMTDDGDPLATIQQRISARVIDVVLVFIVGAMIGLFAVGGDPEQDIPLWARLVSLAWVFFYETLLVVWRGQTVGKMIAGIEIVSLASGETPNLVASAARMVPVISLFVLLQQFVYPALVFLYFSAAFLSNNRGILDRVAGTVVIQGRRPGVMARSFG
ncbi:MAG: RDD family protein [Actinomycetota bacterium]